jgi:hypothetical protein
VKCTIYLEGGGESGDLRSRCREGFRKLLEQCGYEGRMPKLVACGGRTAVFDSFKTAMANIHEGDFFVLWIDSENRVADTEKTWGHLVERDGWSQPPGAENENVLLMTTCMETLIVADRDSLKGHYGARLQLSALPPNVDLEVRSRDSIQNGLAHATRNCTNAFKKGKRSFEVLSHLGPDTLKSLLPSFARACRILDQRL